MLVTALSVALLQGAGARAAQNRDGIAVIIGNKSYQGRVPAVVFAHNDAEAIKAFVIKRLGYRPGNVIDLRDATLATSWARQTGQSSPGSCSVSWSRSIFMAASQAAAMALPKPRRGDGSTKQGGRNRGPAKTEFGRKADPDQRGATNSSGGLERIDRGASHRFARHDALNVFTEARDHRPAAVVFGEP